MEMRTKKLLLAIGVLVLVVVALAIEAWDRRPVWTPTITNEILASAAGNKEGWLSHGRDWSNQRYAPLAQINPQSVQRLERLWHHNPHLLFRSSVRNESTPIVVDDLILYTNPDNVVLAVDAGSGKERWRYQPELGPLALCCGVVNRGVAIYGDAVYLATLDARVIALDRSDGSELWQVSAAEPQKGYSFTMAPLAADGKIIVGVSGGEFGIRGFVDAYDPSTGKRLWRFWTIPSPEEGGWYGNWSRTTPDGERLPRNITWERRDSAHYAEAWRQGGAAVWSTPAYDPELGLLILGTGNPYPVDGVYAPGDNLYSVSIVALDISTGKMKWYYQMVPHDMWDYDASSPPVLFDLETGDGTTPAVGHAGKTGWVYILDRRTGRQIRRSDPFIPQENIFPTPTRKGTRASPAVRGGSNWPPPAYSPRTGMLYVLGSYVPMLFILDSAQKSGAPYRHARFKKLPDSLAFGTFSAVDMRSGKVRWQRKTPRHLMYSGALATAGDLVFFGDAEGWLSALHAETGETLWRYRVDDSYIGPPISFLLDGAQVVAITSRRGISVFGLSKTTRPQ